MNIDFTNREFRVSVFGLLFALFIGVVLLTLSGCSPTLNQETNNQQLSFSGDKSFSFKDDGSSWRVDFEDDEISALYKNGNRVPDSEVDQYKEMVYKNLGKLRSKYDKLSVEVHRFHFDADQLNKKMEKLQNDLDEEKFFHSKFEFDEDEFEKNMEQLEEQLKDLKDKKIELYFDSEDFQDNMKELQEKLKDMPITPIPPDIDIDIKMNMDDFKEGMKSLRESLKELDIKIDTSDWDFSELKNSIIELKKNMKGLKIELKGMKGEMKKLNSFLDELKSELVNDGYITSTDDDFDLEMSKDTTLINDLTVKSEHHKKYLELYKRHFDKELEGTIKINRD